MSEFPPPAVDGDAALRLAPALTPAQVDAVLADFRAWLSAPAVAGEAPPPDEDAGPDLYTLLEQLTALRHEVNLQTKSSRTQQEQNAATLAELTRSLDALQQAKPSPSDEDGARPFLKSLVELYDALAVASREARRVQDTVLPLLSEASAEDAPEPLTRSMPGLARWLFPGLAASWDAVAARYKQEIERSARQREAFARVRQLLASLTTGYAMSLQRLERTLKQHGLEAVAAAGEPFDPERMEAVDAVTGTDVPPGRVVDEVQRGYLRNGRVFRYAKVRVAK